MTEVDLPEDTENEEGGEGKKGKTGKTETGSMGRSEVSVTEGFYAKMFAFGASPAQIKEVLSSWRNLSGGGLTRALMDFARRVTRASAHAEVKIKTGSDYSVLHNFIEHLKTIRQSPEQELKNKQEQQKKMQDRHQHRPEQNGPKFH